MRKILIRVILSCPLIFLISFDCFSQNRSLTSYPFLQQTDTLILTPVNNPALNEYSLRRMAVDKQNNLWLATDKGIVKFNGNDLTVFDKSDNDTATLTTNSVGAIYFDEAGLNLYVIGAGTCIDELNTKTGKVTHLKITLRDEDKTKYRFAFAFSCLYIDSDSTIWAGMYNIGFVHFDPRTDKTDYYNIPLQDESLSIVFRTVSDIQPDPDRSDILWIGTFNGIYSFNKKSKQLSRIFHCSRPTDSTRYDLTIKALDAKQKDTIWFAIPVYGFGCYDKISGCYTIMRDTSKQTGKLINHNIDRIQRKNDQQIFMSSDVGLPGIFNTVDHSYSYKFRLKENYPAVQQQDYLEDSLGNFWSLTFNQLFKAEKNNKSFSTVFFPNVSSPDNIPNFFRISVWDEKSQVYYTVFDGRREVAVLDKDMKQVRTIPIDLSFTNNLMIEPTIYDAILDKKGRLWLLGQAAVWVYDEHSDTLKLVNRQKINFPPMAPQNMIYRGNYIYLQPSRPGFNAIYRVNINDLNYDSIPLPEQITSEKSNMNQLGKQMDVLEMDSKGEVAYLCYGLTLFQFNLLNGEVKKITTLPAEYKGFQHFYNMFWYKLDAKNNLWVSLTKGITIYDGTSLKIIKEIPVEKDSYPLALCHADAQQVMCYLYSKGVILFDYNKEGQFKLSLSDGLATLFNSGISVANNTIFVGASDYVHYTSLSGIVNSNQQRRCYLSNIALFNQPYRRDTVPELLHLIKLPHDKNYISFTISSTEFEQPERLEYRYKLEGLNPDWIYVNYLNRTVTYTNVQPGNYTFYGMVKNADGKWSNDGIKLQLIIVPAWWQTSWFALACVAAACVIAFVLIRWRIRTVRKQEQEKARIEKEILELEAKALRAQMNPHFIFNCMNSIKSLIQKNEHEKAIEYLTTFSKLIRTIFQNSDKREITLHDEIETCRLYTQLESMRFSNKLNYSFDIDEQTDFKSVMVPPLILQPFIENAIWHGLMPKAEGGMIYVRVTEKENKIYCIVEDDGIGRNVSMQNKFKGTIDGHQSKGMRLTQSRLELNNSLNQRNATVEIIDKTNDIGAAAGTKVILMFSEE